jgi:hypothetical protein
VHVRTFRLCWEFRFLDGQIQSPRTARLHTSNAYCQLTQSGAVLAKKAGALRKSLEKLGVELVCPTAPHRIVAADVSDPSERAKLVEAESQDGGWEYWGWSVLDEDKREMRGLDVSVAEIGKLMEEQVGSGMETDLGTVYRYTWIFTGWCIGCSSCVDVGTWTDTEFVSAD